jgi:chromate transport protein ChrA
MVSAATGKDTRRTVTHWLLYLLVASLPVLMTVGVVVLYLDTDLSRLVPGTPDEIRYYLQIQGTAHAGLDTGYFTVEEDPAPVSFLRYGPHGPLFPLLYGGLAALAGWPHYAAMIVNVGAWVLALIALLAATRPDRAQLLLMIGVIAPFFPALIFWPSNMQESLHQAIGILLAAGTYRLLKDDSPRLRVALFAFVAFASLIRYTWAFYFPILLLLGLPRPAFRQGLVTLAQGLGLALAALVAFTLLASPVKHNFITDFLDALPDSPSHAFELLGDNLSHNAHFVLGDDSTFGRGGWIVLIMLVFAVAIAALFVIRARRAGPESNLWREAAFHALNLLPVTLLSFVLYDVWQGYRTLSAHVLASLLLLILTRRFRPVLAFVAASLVCIPLFPKLGDPYFDANFFYRESDIDAVTAATEPFLRYDPEASGGWCNTVLVSVSNYNARLTHLDPGLGAAMLYDVDALSMPPRSKFLLLNREDASAVRDQTPLEYLADTPGARLYYNPISGCAADWPQGLSPEIAAEYEAFTPRIEIPADARLFVAAPGDYEDFDALATPVSRYLTSAQVDPQVRDTLFDLLALLEHSTGPSDTAALKNWRASKLPGDLQAAGADYVLVNKAWLDTLSDVESQLIVGNTAMYQPVITLTLQGLGEDTYTLYRATGTARRDTFGLPADLFEAYEASTPEIALPPDAIVLNPSQGMLAQRADVAAVYGVYAGAMPDDALFQTLHILEHVARPETLHLDGDQRAAFDRWQSMRDPADLQAAGIEYLIVHDGWIDALPDDQQATWRSGYERVPDWSLDFYYETYALYRVRP